MDTPEKVWGHLDEGQLHEAAERFVRAGDVYAKVDAASRSRFPLLRHQWPLVQKLRGEIERRADGAIAEAECGIEVAAAALATLALMDESVTAPALLSRWLEARCEATARAVRGADTASGEGIACWPPLRAS